MGFKGKGVYKRIQDGRALDYHPPQSNSCLNSTIYFKNEFSKLATVEDRARVRIDII